MAAEEDSALVFAFRNVLSVTPSLKGPVPPFRGAAEFLGVRDDVAEHIALERDSPDNTLPAAVALLNLLAYSSTYPAPLVMHAISTAIAARPGFAVELAGARDAWGALASIEGDNIVLAAISMASSVEAAFALRSAAGTAPVPTLHARVSGSWSALRARHSEQGWIERAISAALGPILPILAGVPVSVASDDLRSAPPLTDASAFSGNSGCELDHTWNEEAFGFRVLAGDVRLAEFSAAVVASAITGPFTAMPSPEAGYAAARAYARLRRQAGRPCSVAEIAVLRRAVLVYSMRVPAQFAVLDDPILSVPDGTSREDSSSGERGVHLALALPRAVVASVLGVGAVAKAAASPGDSEPGRLLGPAAAMGLGVGRGQGPLFDDEDSGEEADNEGEGKRCPHHALRPLAVERALGSFLHAWQARGLCAEQGVRSVARGRIWLLGQEVHVCVRASEHGDVWAWPMVSPASANAHLPTAWQSKRSLVCLPLSLEPPQQENTVHFVAELALSGGPGATNEGPTVPHSVCGDTHGPLVAARDLTAWNLGRHLDPESLGRSHPLPCRTLLSRAVDGRPLPATTLGGIATVGASKWLARWCPEYIWLRVQTD